MKIATYNINSVRLRIERVLRLLKEHDIDILCLQETKVVDELFPSDAFINAGFPHLYFKGEKSYNGVAIISRYPMTNIECLPMLKGDCRHISARIKNIELHNFYVPAGGDVPDPALNDKFDFKLKFVDEMHGWFNKNRKANDNMILVGDFNIAPQEHDVWSHKQLLKIVSHTPVEVEKITNLFNGLNWQDAARHFTPPDKKLYSWWSYRNQDWRKSDRGRRLDHIWVTNPLKSGLKSCDILKDYRDGEQPSDHVPVIMNLEV
jgi:exodeoxyribonuclease III